MEHMVQINIKKTYIAVFPEEYEVDDFGKSLKHYTGITLRTQK